MRNVLFLNVRIGLALLMIMVYGCGKAVAEKPENLIPEEQMVEIFYDLALLDAIKTQKPVALQTNNIATNDYIYKKYKIDSMQFVNSNRYYASDLDRYKEMYEKVSRKLEANKKTIDEALMKNGGIKPVDPDAPRVE